MIWLATALFFTVYLYPDLLLATVQGGGQSAPDITGDLPRIVAVITALSVASERLVEIIKGWLPWLNETWEGEGWEAFRKSILQMMAVVAGIVTAWLGAPAIQSALPSFTTKTHTFALGLLASGGSGAWNSFTNYLLQLKNLTKAEVKKVKSGSPPSN
jgi:hypothetical protein